ncbi:MAG: PQQ-dependent sugar dehydrogenase [Acidimicrobiia bacterium]
MSRRLRPLSARFRWALLAVVLVAPGGPFSPLSPPRAEASVPAGFADQLVAAVPVPTDVAFTPDGRMLVTSQTGELRVVQNGTLLANPAVSLAVCANKERGLVGVTVDPNFAANHFIYLYYTVKVGTCPTQGPFNRVSRFTLSDGNAAGSEKVLVDNIASLGNHNAGDLNFGPTDGLLYVSVGDAGCRLNDTTACQNDNDNARSNSILNGKILRVKPTDGSFPTGTGGNPHAGAGGVRRCGDPAGLPSGTGPCGEIWATGLRNPFRFSFKPEAPHTMHINDVGTFKWEEIDKGVAGADYGFNLREGPCVLGSGSNCPPPPAGLTDPVFSYRHGDVADGDLPCTAVTGSAWVPDGLWPAPYSGSSLFSDYACGRIFRLTPSGSGFTAVPFATTLGGGAGVSIGFGPAGSTRGLYYTSFNDGGQVRRIISTAPTAVPPIASFTTTPASSPTPATVTFNASGSSDPDNDGITAYTWNFGDGSPAVTENDPSTTHAYGKGAFTATLVVTDGDGQKSAPFTRLIEVGTPPAAFIDGPPASSVFAVGQTVTVTGHATDDTAPAPTLTWEVIRRHDSHTHPFLAPVTGPGITLGYPSPEDLSAANTSFLEVRLTATDADGLSRTVTRALNPRKVNVTFTNNQSAGLPLQVNDASISGAKTLTSWVGFILRPAAPLTTTLSGATYTFQSWSHGEPAAHAVVSPNSAATYKANFIKTTSGSPPAPFAIDTIVGTPNGQGWWLAATDGRVFPTGNAGFFGNATPGAGTPVTGMAATATGNGYWLATTNGQIFAKGGAPFHGDVSHVRLAKPVVGMTARPQGDGYWMVATDGGLFTFGAAGFFGSTGNVRLNQPMVGMAPTPSGQGYWLVAADGGVFTFGDAKFFGSTGNVKLNKPVIGILPTSTGKGYWLFASDGGMFTFGDAKFFGSTGGKPPATPVTGVSVTPDGKGYWIVATDGAVFNFGNAGFFF